MRCNVTVGYAAYRNAYVECSKTFFFLTTLCMCTVLCSCILCIFFFFYSQLCLHFIVARPFFSLVIIYFMHSVWFLSLIIWTAKECCMTLLPILGFFAKLALTRLCNAGVWLWHLSWEGVGPGKKKIFHICIMGLQKACFFCVSYVAAVGLYIWYFGSSPNVLQCETIICETYISCSS